MKSGGFPSLEIFYTFLKSFFLAGHFYFFYRDAFTSLSSVIVCYPNLDCLSSIGFLIVFI